MTFSWQVGDLRIDGIPTNFWLRANGDIPAIFSVVDPDGTAWSWAAFVGDEMIRGRGPLAEALAAALDAMGIVGPERTRLLAEFEAL